jgi:hypothetical protein
MQKFETYLEKATAKGANIVPGAVMAVVDVAGNGRIARSLQD